LPRLLQLPQCRLGRVARRTNGCFGVLPLGNVGVDQHDPATDHRIPVHFDDPSVGARALEPHLPACIVNGAAQFRFEIGRVLTALSEVAENFDVARSLGEEGIGQIQHLLEIVVPRGEPRLGVEHRDAVPHVVESDAQLSLALAQLAEEARILHRDHRLSREILQQRNLLVAKGTDFLAVDDEIAEEHPVLA
jgi:hypothetical protein